MSRIKRFAVGKVLVLILLVGSPVLWYQSHYVAPVVLPTPLPLPSPNGFDTLEQAKDLQRFPIDGETSHYWGYLTPAERQKLLTENLPSLEKTRQALTQEYRMPRTTDFFAPPYYSRHQELLVFAAKTYTESGSLSEAMRCALDSMEVGVMVPHGGYFFNRETGTEYETRGRQLAWQLVARVDASAARAAVDRLERIDARRWPLAESLRDELRTVDFKSEISEFRAGPMYVWEKMSVDSPLEGARPAEQVDRGSDFRVLWRRAQAVYHGPRWVLYSIEDCVKRAQTRFDSPWQPDRPDRIAETPYSIDEYRYREMVEYFNRAQCALLKASLARHAYTQERGTAPRSLEELVSAGYLKAVPVDPFSPTRAPLRYKPDSGKLWSVGPDAVDDSGEQAVFVKGKWQWRGQFRSGDLVSGKNTSASIFYIPRPW